MELNTGRKRSKSKILLLASLTLVVIFASVAGFFFWKWQSLRSNTSVEAEVASARVLTKVGKIYALPQDEKPTVAQIQDKNKLKDQSFFDNAQNGDYLIMYTNAKLALLYREKDNRLINVGPITIQNDKADTSEQEPTTQDSAQESSSSPAAEEPSAQP